MTATPRHQRSIDEPTLAELAAMADGSLPATRLPELWERVEASPQLAQALERQRHAVRVVRGTSVAAPHTLRARLELEGQRRRPPRRRGLPRPVTGALATACAAAAVIAVVAMQSGTSEPSVGGAVQLASLGPAEHAPLPNSKRPALLRQTGAGLPFPNLEQKFGWRATGVLEAEVDGRPSTTVFYEKGNRTLAYTILSGDALDPPANARLTRKGGIEFASFDADGQVGVTWLRRGRTCVLSGERTSATELLELASWTGKGTITA